MKKKMVSVCMITYGHELYIKEAIESVLMQHTDFDYELIIADDCSPDATENVVRSLIESHKNRHRIRYTKHKENLGMMPNFVYTLKQCNGKYIALCEGDDYWTDPLKLQKQVDFLEANHDYGICFHNIEVFNQSTGELVTDNITRNVPETTTITELAKGNFIHTPSVMLRNDFKIPDWFKKTPLGDWVLYMLAIEDKKIKKLEDCMAVYRVHDTSLWSSQPRKVKIDKTLISMNLVLKNIKTLPGEVRSVLNEKIKELKPKQKKTSYSVVINRVVFFLKNLLKL